MVLVLFLISSTLRCLKLCPRKKKRLQCFKISGHSATSTGHCNLGWRINVLCCRGSTLYIILLVPLVGSGRLRVIVFCMKSDYLLSKEEKDNWEWLLWKSTENLCRRQIFFFFLSASGKTGFIKSVKLLAWHFQFNWGVWVFNICSVESQRSLHVGSLWTSKHTLTSPVVQG